jgi:hypothetical protein
MDAVHAILYSSNPMQRGIVHKSGPPGANCPAKETFVDLEGAYSQAERGSQLLFGEGTQEEEACDPWTLWAQASAGKGFTAQQVTTLIFQSLVFVAMAVGAYLAFNAVLRMYDVKYSELASGIGKVTAVFAKNLSQKADAIREKVSSNINPLSMAPASLATPVALARPVKKRVIAPEPED